MSLTLPLRIFLVPEHCLKMLSQASQSKNNSERPDCVQSPVSETYWLAFLREPTILSGFVLSE